MHSDPAERELRVGWRAWLYRGRHHQSSRRLGHTATRLALRIAVALPPRL